MALTFDDRVDDGGATPQGYVNAAVLNAIKGAHNALEALVQALQGDVGDKADAAALSAVQAVVAAQGAAIEATVSESELAAGLATRELSTGIVELAGAAPALAAGHDRQVLRLTHAGAVLTIPDGLPAGMIVSGCAVGGAAIQGAAGVVVNGADGGIERVGPADEGALFVAMRQPDGSWLVSSTPSVLELADTDLLGEVIDWTAWALAGAALILKPGGGVVPAAMVPLAPATVAEVLTGAAGSLYVTPAVRAAALGMRHGGETSGALTIAASQGVNWRVTAVGDVTVAGLAGAIDGEVYRLLIVGGAGGPHQVAFGAAVTAPGALPGEATPGEVTLATGETLALQLMTYLTDEVPAVRHTDVLSAVIVGEPAPAAPTFVSASISPAVGGDGATFTATYEAAGVPEPDATYAWRRNGAAVAGTAASHAAPAGFVGRVECDITLTNASGSATRRVAARVGDAQPELIGQELLLNESSSVTITSPIALAEGAQAGDYALLLMAQQTGSEPALPAGFAALAASIQNPTPATAGSNFWTTVAGKFLSAGEVAAGEIDVTLRSNSMAGLLVVRGVDAVSWDPAAFARAAAGATSVALGSRDAARPALAVALVASGRYNDFAKTAACAGWDGGPVLTHPYDLDGRNGLRALTRLLPPGASPAGTVTMTGAVGSATRALATLILLYGPED